MAPNRASHRHAASLSRAKLSGDVLCCSAFLRGADNLDPASVRLRKLSAIITRAGHNRGMAWSLLSSSYIGSSSYNLITSAFFKEARRLLFWHSGIMEAWRGPCDIEQRSSASIGGYRKKAGRHSAAARPGICWFTCKAQHYRTN